MKLALPVSMIATLPVTSAVAETIPGMPAGTTGTSVALEMAAILTGIIVLILALGWIFKRMGNFPAAGKGMVRIVGGVSLGPRERAVVLEAGDKRLLVGVAPGRVETLCMLDSEQSSNTETDNNDFASQLDAQLPE